MEQMALVYSMVVDNSSVCCSTHRSYSIHGVWAMVMSFIVFAALKYTIGLRVSEEEEQDSIMSEHGQIAYPGKRVRE